MGFHADRPVVGLRIFIVLAVLLGVTLLGFGYYALFRADLTGRAAREDVREEDRPNIVLVLLPPLRADISEADMPTLRRLRAENWHAPAAFAESMNASDSVRDLLQVYSLEGKAEWLPTALESQGYTIAGYDPRAVPEQPALPDVVDEMVTWLRAKGHRQQPFFAAVPCGSPEESAQAIDAKLGQIVDTLNAIGLESRTVVLLTSAGGNPAATIPERWQVPLVLRYPRRFSRATTVTAPVSPWDIAPTILGLTGLAGEMRGARDSQDLLRAHLRNAWRPYVIVEDDTRLYCFIDGTWLVRSADGEIVTLDGGEADTHLRSVFERAVAMRAEGGEAALRGGAWRVTFTS